MDHKDSLKKLSTILSESEEDAKGSPFQKHYFTH